MKSKLFLGLSLIFSLGISGCGETKKLSDTRTQWLDVPALPILQNAVFSLVDSLAPHKNPVLMEQLCALAKGETQQEDVNAFIQQQGVTARDIPLQGHSLSLLVNGDKQSQVRACAAYLAITVLTPLNLTSLSIVTPDSVPENESRNSAQLEPQIDQAKLLAILPHKLAIAQTNADFFAIVAAELQRRPGLTLEQYHQLSIEMFSRLAPDYLQRVKAHLPSPATQYKVITLDKNQFIFISSTRTSFAYDFSGLKLRHNGIVWFGEGMLLGKEYFLKTVYLPESAKQLTNIQH